jgi:DNA-directed RNA polymerase
MIRFKASHETQKARAIDEYEAIDMPEVYNAINYIQNVPWRINQRVLDVVQEAWEKDLAIASLPRKEAEYVRPRPEGIEKGSEEWKTWAKEAGAANTRRPATLRAARDEAGYALRRGALMGSRRDAPDYGRADAARGGTRGHARASSVDHRFRG